MLDMEMPELDGFGVLEQMVADNNHRAAQQLQRLRRVKSWPATPAPSSPPPTPA